MTVVGKISSEGTLNVFGRVEGELHASIVRISDGAEVEGTIAAQELTIGGRFKGTIQADRVMLSSSAVVEGEIHHRSLAIEENAWVRWSVASGGSLGERGDGSAISCSACADGWNPAGQWFARQGVLSRSGRVSNKFARGRLPPGS